VEDDNVDVVCIPASSGFFEARFAYIEVVEFRSFNEASHMRYMLWIEVTAFERDVGICSGRQRKSKALPEPELARLHGRSMLAVSRRPRRRLAVVSGRPCRSARSCSVSAKAR
jgi:hypothetical protein